MYQLKVYLEIRNSQLMPVIFRQESSVTRPLCTCIRGRSVGGTGDRGLDMAPNGISFINLARNSTGATIMDLGIQTMGFIVPQICGVPSSSHLLSELCIVPGLEIIGNEWLFSYPFYQNSLALCSCCKEKRKVSWTNFISETLGIHFLGASHIGVWLAGWEFLF